MTRHLDPDRRRPAPTHPGFDPREIDVDMDICRWCGAHVPAAEVARVKHEDWEQRIANRFAQLIERVAILEATVAQPSGSGSRPVPSATASADASPDPDPNVPTPPQEVPGFGHPNRDGVADANQGSTRPDAGTPPSDVTTPPGAISPPVSGGTNRGAGRSNLGREATGRLHLIDPEPPDDQGFAL